MSTWIDFKALRAALEFEQVLAHYGVEVKRKGAQHLGFCPLPNHQGKRNSQSFSANLDRGIFKCFGCGAQGNILDFAALMENLDPTEGHDLRKAAVSLRDRFVPQTQGSNSRNPKGGVKAKSEAPAPLRAIPALVNQPLDFELKDLDREHPYLLKRGFTTETIARFGLGFCRRGLLKDRVVIPLHDHDEKLIGYAGRVIDDDAISEDNPRYRFPGKRERDGKIFEFHKTLFIYNGYRIKAPVDDLIVVEGFTSVWWLTQNGLPHVVATMGADCSDKQADVVVTLVKPNGRVWIVPDGDKAGARHAQTLLALITPYRLVRWPRCFGQLRSLTAIGSPTRSRRRL